MSHPIARHRVHLKRNHPNLRWLLPKEHGDHPGTAISATEIEVDGEVLVLADPSCVTLQPGEEVYIWRDPTGHFSMEPMREKQARDLVDEQRAAEKQKRERLREIQRRQDATAFWESYQIPFPYMTGLYPVLSGLSERSFGDGCFESTVVHLRIERDIEIGRLTREKGLFLCTPSQRHMGKMWVESDHLAYDSEGKYMPPITCQACLSIMERWKKTKEK